jgi:predicted secreted protein
MTYLEVPANLAPEDLVAAINDRMRRLTAAQPASAGGAAASGAVSASGTRILNTSTVLGIGLTLAVRGTLGIEADAAPALYLPAPQTPTGVRAYLKTAPAGAALTITIYLGATAWLALTIADGQTSATATSAALVAAGLIAAGVNIRLGITAVGTTFPGADLSVFIYF